MFWTASEPELAAMKQKLLDAQRNIDELTDENNTLVRSIVA